MTHLNRVLEDGITIYLRRGDVQTLGAAAGLELYPPDEQCVENRTKRGFNVRPPICSSTRINKRRISRDIREDILV